MPTIVVSSAIANKPHNGGNAWAVLNWVLGLKELGLDVYFLEQIAGRDCVDAAGAPCSFADSVNLAFFRATTERFGLAGSSALVCDEGTEIHGLSNPDLLAIADASSLLVNITGHLRLKPLLRRVRHRAYIDLDPGFTQYWHASGDRGARLEGHDSYFTVGENIGTAACPIPTGGVPWRPIRQPILLARCPEADGGDPSRFTTVASWRGAYGRVQHGDRTFGLKAHEFRKFLDVPRRIPSASFEIALDIHPADVRDRDALVEHGWKIADPKAVASDVDAFHRYVQGSGAEFSAAQGIYVETHSGWFSDRTVRYLASGRPALVQETGFSRNLPVGEGLLAFRTIDEAASGAKRILGDYEAHRRAARQVAVDYFDSNRVLGRFLDQVSPAG